MQKFKLWPWGQTVKRLLWRAFTSAPHVQWMLNNWKMRFHIDFSIISRPQIIRNGAMPLPEFKGPFELPAASLHAMSVFPFYKKGSPFEMLSTVTFLPMIFRWTKLQHSFNMHFEIRNTPTYCF